MKLKQISKALGMPEGLPVAAEQAQLRAATPAPPTPFELALLAATIMAVPSFDKDAGWALRRAEWLLALAADPGAWRDLGPDHLWPVEDSR